MVKNPPSHAGDEGSIPSRGTKSPHARGQTEKPQLLSLCSTIREAPTCRNEDPHYMDGGDAEILVVLIHSCKFVRVFKEEVPKHVPNPSFNDLTSRLFGLLNLAVNCTIHQRKKCVYNSQSNPVRIHTLPLFSPTQYYFSSFPVPSRFTKSIPFILRYIMTN